MYIEEQELYDWLVVCASIGYQSRDDVIGIVRKFLRSKKEDSAEDFIGKGWW